MPGSLASLLLYPENIQHPLYAMLSLVSVFELAWCAILVLVLRRVRGVSGAAALGATVCTWTLLAALQLAITSYFAAA
jgi:cobalamin biosynthesis protein CobD/CbiB